MTAHRHEWRDFIRQVVVKGMAAFALAFVLVLAVAGLDELRGALAVARFNMARRTAEKAHSADRMNAVLDRASGEADLIMECGSPNAQTLWELSRTCQRWSRQEKVKNPLLRLEVAEKAAQAAALAAYAAPSDYTNWLQLARVQAALGLKESARSCKQHARTLAPSHMLAVLAERQAKR